MCSAVFLQDLYWCFGIGWAGVGFYMMGMIGFIIQALALRKADSYAPLTDCTLRSVIVLFLGSDLFCSTSCYNSEATYTVLFTQNL